ncbi:MAG: response regulator transcription factor [Bradyrhizobium sp.]
MSGLNLSTVDLRKVQPGLASFDDAEPLVAIVDDDACARRSLGELIVGKGWHPLTFASAEEFLDHTSHASAPNCLILELNLPEMGGLALQQLIAPRMADTPIIFLAGQGTVSASVRAMKAGAVEFFTKPTCDEVMTSAIERAIALNRTSLVKSRETRSIEVSYASLSLREREVMDLVVSGHLNKVVGFQLGISEITVKAHRGQVMRKMRARSFADLVNMASKLRASTVSSH